MNRIFRLTRSSDIQRVRRLGSSYAHPLLVLIVEKAQEQPSFKIAFLASKSLGIAVSRNRAKRILRAANEQYLGKILPGNNLLIIARAGLLTSSFTGVQSALYQVFSKAKIIKDND